MFLAHRVFRTSSCLLVFLDVVWLRCKQNCQRYPKILLLPKRMLLEVGPDLHGEPSVPQMRPG